MTYFGVWAEQQPPVSWASWRGSLCLVFTTPRGTWEEGLGQGQFLLMEQSWELSAGPETRKLGLSPPQTWTEMASREITVLQERIQSPYPPPASRHPRGQCLHVFSHSKPKAWLDLFLSSQGACEQRRQTGCRCRKTTFQPGSLKIWHKCLYLWSQSLSLRYQCCQNFFFLPSFLMFKAAILTLGFWCENILLSRLVPCLMSALSNVQDVLCRNAESASLPLGYFSLFSYQLLWCWALVKGRRGHSLHAAELLKSWQVQHITLNPAL